jgi:hypothetical protein
VWNVPFYQEIVDIDAAPHVTKYGKGQAERGWASFWGPASMV